MELPRRSRCLSSTTRAACERVPTRSVRLPYTSAYHSNQTKLITYWTEAVNLPTDHSLTMADRYSFSLTTFSPRYVSMRLSDSMELIR